MFRKIKEYREYRRNIRFVKKEIAKIGCTALPLLNTGVKDYAAIIAFLTRAAKETEKMEGDEILSYIEKTAIDISKVFADKLETDSSRLFELMAYIATLSPQDIQKIIAHAQVETLKGID